MQTPGITNQDSQQSPYITLQPVNVEQNDLTSNTMVQGGMNLQSAVLGSSNEIPRDDKQSITGDGGQQQVVLNQGLNKSCGGPLNGPFPVQTSKAFSQFSL